MCVPETGKAETNLAMSKLDLEHATSHQCLHAKCRVAPLIYIICAEFTLAPCLSIGSEDKLKPLPCKLGPIQCYSDGIVGKWRWFP